MAGEWVMVICMARAQRNYTHDDGGGGGGEEGEEGAAQPGIIQLHVYIKSRRKGSLEFCLTD